MAQVRPFKFDIDGFPIELDIATDDLTINSLTVDSGIAMGASQITGLADGSLSTDAVTKGQLDSLAAGFDRKQSVRIRTVLDLSGYTEAGSAATKTLTAPTNAASHNTHDGVLLALNDRVLVTTAGSAADIADSANGIYEVTVLGDGATVNFELTRTGDANADAEVTAGLFTFVTEGTVHADTGWYLVTNDPITLDTTALAFSQFAGVGTFTGGDGIDITAGVISVDLVAAGALEFATGQLQINLEASNPSLVITATELGVKFSAVSGLEKVAAGLQVKTDGTTIQINGSGQLEVIGGGTVDQYNLTAGVGGVTIGDPIYVSANDTGLPIDNASNNTRKFVGVAAATVAAAASFALQQENLITPTSIGGSPAAGDLVWAASPSGVTVVLPTGSGTHRMIIGKMKNATEVIIEPQYISKIA